jgi:hypothetical protein
MKNPLPRQARSEPIPGEMRLSRAAGRCIRSALNATLCRLPGRGCGPGTGSAMPYATFSPLSPPSVRHLFQPQFATRRSSAQGAPS